MTKHKSRLRKWPDWVDAEHVAQLTAEKSIREYVKGRGGVREWVKLRERN